MHELSIATDMVALQSVADVAGLHRHRHCHRRHGSYRKNVCLVSLNGSLNGVGILNIGNGWGGGGWGW